MNKRIENYFINLKNTIDNLNISELDKAVQLFKGIRKDGHQIFVLGNGGSAATANHFLCDFGKNAVQGNEKRFKVISLCSGVEVMTAYANDVAYESIFEEQLKSVLNEGDVVLAISASGNSPNIISAVQYAKKSNAIIIGMTGGAGGKLKELSDIALHVESDVIEQVEDIHLIFAHIIVYLFKHYQNELVC